MGTETPVEKWHRLTREAEDAEGTPRADELWQQVAEIEATLSEEDRGY